MPLEILGGILALGIILKYFVLNRENRGALLLTMLIVKFAVKIITQAYEVTMDIYLRCMRDGRYGNVNIYFSNIHSKGSHKKLNFT